ncbi:STT3 domain-containing protein [Sulfurimonas sp. HSL3-7]|uniref:STT3 domain-containing protein n=1 Tax=Sulfonitrofixus jiaomeiensis TaxID=3131938 RepID=UPI0031F94B6E
MQEKTDTKPILLFIFFAYLFSFLVRMIWVYQFQGNPQFIWNDQLMINTNDGYYFASGAQKWLEGTLQYNPRVPELYRTAAITLSAYIAKIMPFSLDSVILYMPAVVSSLVIIPIILIGRLFGMPAVGFFAALLGSIAWSYYNRTMIGYYDTDMFSAMAPMFILYFLLATIKTEKTIFALLSALSFLIYPFLYDQGRAVVYAIGIIYMVYMVVFHRRDAFTYHSILLISVGLMDINAWAQFAIIIALFVAIKRELISANLSLNGSIITVFLFLYTGHVFDLIWMKISLYFNRGVESSGLHFFQVSQTVREAGLIPFDTMANRISGSVIGVFAALAGYIVLVLRHKEFILALPLIGIGLFSLMGGLRFTVYAVPVAAISAIYLFHVFARYTNEKKLYYPVLTVLTAAMIYPNITHIIGYKVPTVFTKQEVQILDNFKAKSSSKDYVITWWDYGYPIWYYGNKNTLIDGGKHNNDNFIVSEILLSTSPLEAARLSRLAVEAYVGSNYDLVTNTLFKNKKEDQVDVSAYLENLRYGDVTLPQQSRDIYLYLPMRMLDILPTVKLFSNLDLKTGQPLSKPFFYSTRQFRDSGTVLQLGNGIALMKYEGKLQIGDQKVPLGQFIRINYDQSGKPNIQRQTITPMSRLSVIYLEDMQRFVVLDNEYMNSTYIQMYLFNNYDSELFEPVILDPLTKIYRLKI